VQRVAPAVIRYAETHSFPLEYSDRASAELADQDLALIPLLHDSAALDAKIAETLTALQDLGSADLGSNEAMPHAASIATQAEVDQIRVGIETIDHVNVEAVMPFFMRLITSSSEIKLCIADRSELALRYDTAIKELEQSLAARNDVQVAPEQIPLPPSEAEPPAASPSIQLCTATLEELASLPAAEIMSSIEGAEGDALLTRVGVSRPTAAVQSSVDRWMTKTMAKPSLQRRSEMANFLAKKIDVSGQPSLSKCAYSRARRNEVKN
jgi:hypothetical protein